MHPPRIGYEHASFLHARLTTTSISLLFLPGPSEGVKTLSLAGHPLEAPPSRLVIAATSLRASGQQMRMFTLVLGDNLNWTYAILRCIGKVSNSS